MGRKGGEYKGAEIPISIDMGGRTVVMVVKKLETRVVVYCLRRRQ